MDLSSLKLLGVNCKVCYSIKNSTSNCYTGCSSSKLKKWLLYKIDSLYTESLLEGSDSDFAISLKEKCISCNYTRPTLFEEIDKFLEDKVMKDSVDF